MQHLRVCSFGMIRIRNSHPRSLGSWRIKETDVSTLDKDPSVRLMYHDPSELGSLILIWIIPKESPLQTSTQLVVICINYLLPMFFQSRWPSRQAQLYQLGLQRCNL